LYQCKDLQIKFWGLNWEPICQYLAKNLDVLSRLVLKKTQIHFAFMLLTQVIWFFFFIISKNWSLWRWLFDLSKFWEPWLYIRTTCFANKFDTCFVTFCCSLNMRKVILGILRHGSKIQWKWRARPWIGGKLESS